jgi:uncharacterized Zn finger protein
MYRNVEMALMERLGHMHFKACPRCKGDMREVQEVIPREFVSKCIQCGYQIDTVHWLERRNIKLGVSYDRVRAAAS